MGVEKINTIAMDLDLDRCLNPYKVNGRDALFGHVLVRKIEKSPHAHISSNWQTLFTHDITDQNIIASSCRPSSLILYLAPPVHSASAGFGRHSLSKGCKPSNPFTYLAFLPLSPLSTHIGVPMLTSCRPREPSGPLGKVWDYPVTSYRATQRLDVEGIYTLLPESQLKTGGWVNLLRQIKGAVGSYGTRNIV
jgi:hypothetical protein